MIGQIGPLVKAGYGISAALLHILGGALGGMVTGLILAVCSATLLVMGFQWPSPAILLPALLFAFALVHSVGMIRVAGILAFDRQTPASWSCQLGARGAVFAWGVDLGFGWSTRLSTVALLAIAVAAVLGPNPLLAMLAGLAYGIVRTAIPALIAAFSKDAAYASTRVALLNDWSRTVSVVLASFGGALCLSLVV